MKILKSIFIVLTMILILGIFQPKASAIEVRSFDEMKVAVNTFIHKGESGNSGISTSAMGDIVIPIANILTAIGVIALVGATTIMGIKYMFATPEEAAKLKQQLIGLVVAGVVILGATAIWKIVYGIINSTGL